MLCPALCVCRYAVVGILEHLLSDHEFLHELDVLDELLVGITYLITGGALALSNLLEYVEVGGTDDGLTELVGLLDIEQGLLYAHLLSASVRLVLDDHFEGSCQPAVQSLAVLFFIQLVGIFDICFCHFLLFPFVFQNFSGYLDALLCRALISSSFISGNSSRYLLISDLEI